MIWNSLRQLERTNLFRRIVTRTSPQGPVITIGGRRLVNFSSNDYLGLAGSGELADAAVRAVRRFGLGSGASRLLAGGCPLHEQLERAVARFKGTESALVFNSGFDANAGIIPAITRDGDVIFSDELNHASIIDGCRLSPGRTRIYRHGDADHLRTLLARTRAAGRLVVTDTVFSMDGDIAPLDEIFALCRTYGATLYLDDAHGTGVLGNGRGALAHFGMQAEPWVVQMGTFSKALGSHGAFVAGSADMVRWVLNSARSFIFSTALPPPLVGASLAGLKIVSRSHDAVTRLWENRQRVVDGLSDAGFAPGGSGSPILPLMTASVDDALALSSHLLGRGIYAPAIRPPTVRQPRVRITVTAAHTERHISRLLRALREWKGV